MKIKLIDLDIIIRKCHGFINRRLMLGEHNISFLERCIKSYCRSSSSDVKIKAV